MDIVRILSILLGLSLAGASSSSIGSDFESLHTCSKFHFEEKVLEKLVRLDHKMQIFEEKIDEWENSISSKLDKMNDIKQQTETFVETIYDSLQQDQMRFNTSYQEIVEHFKTQIDNETYFYEDKMNTLMKALSSKIQALSAAEQSRDHGLKAMQFTLHQDQKRFNFSYNQIVENFKDNSNKTLQELVLKLQKVPGYDVLAKKRETVAFTAYRKSSQTLSNGQKVIFDQIWTNVGNGYEPSTGVFSAPHAGVYHFTAVVMSTNNNALYLTLYHNTVRTSSSFINGDGHKTGTFDVVFNLQKGDKVYISGEGSYTIYSDSANYVTFSGHIVA